MIGATTTIDQLVASGAEPPSTLGALASRGETLASLLASWLTVALLLAGVLVVTVACWRLWRAARRPQLVFPAPVNGSGVGELDAVLDGLAGLARGALVREIRAVADRVEQYRRDQDARVAPTQTGPLPRSSPDQTLDALASSLHGLGPEVAGGTISMLGQLLARPTGTTVRMVLQRRHGGGGQAGISLELSDLRDAAPLRTATVWDDPVPGEPGSAHLEAPTAHDVAPSASVRAALRGIADELARVHRYEDALEVLRRAEVVAPGEDGDWDLERLARVEAAWRRQREGAARYAFGARLEAAGQRDRARDAFLAALPPAGRTEAATSWQHTTGGAEQAGEAFAQLAVAYDACGLLDAAADLAGRAARSGHRAAATAQAAREAARAGILADVARRCLALADLDGAGRHAEAALASDPDRHDAAEVVAEVARRRPPGDPEAAGDVVIAGEYERHGLAVEARTAYEAALRREPSLQAARSGLARMLDAPRYPVGRYETLLDPAMRWIAIELWRHEALAAVRSFAATESRDVERSRVENVTGSLLLSTALRREALGALEQARGFAALAEDAYQAARRADPSSWRPRANIGDCRAFRARLSPPGAGAALFHTAAESYAEAAERLADHDGERGVDTCVARVTIGRATALLHARADDAEAESLVDDLCGSDGTGGGWDLWRERSWQNLYNLAAYEHVHARRCGSRVRARGREALVAAFLRRGDVLPYAAEDPDLDLDPASWAALAAVEPGRWQAVKTDDEIRDAVRALITELDAALEARP